MLKPSKRSMLSAAIVTTLMMNTACATITRGTTEAFEVQTTPPGATVETSLGMGCGPTPCVIPKVKRNSDFTVTISMDGYETGTYDITHETADGGAAAMAGNVLVGGLIGAGIDAGSGATQSLVPNPLVIELSPSEPSDTEKESDDPSDAAIS